MDNLIFQLRSAGYVILKGALSMDHVLELRETMDAMFEEDESAWGRDTLEALGQRGALRNLCDYSEPFQRLLMDSPIYPVLDAVLGDDYILHSYDGLILFPGQGRFPWDFHTDVTALSGIAFPAGRPPAINCLYYVDTVTELNGATWLIPASHHAMFEHVSPEELAPFAFQATGDPGDALLFDGRLWHCAGENGSDHPRRLIKAMFCQSWLRPQMDYSKAVRPEIQNALDDRSRRLLGRGTAPPGSVQEFRERLAR